MFFKKRKSQLHLIYDSCLEFEGLADCSGMSFARSFLIYKCLTKARLKDFGFTMTWSTL